MSHYADAGELEGELVAFLTAFFASDDGARAVSAARAVGDSARVTLHLLEPDAVVGIDFFAGTVSTEPVEAPDVELEIAADALHDILLDRLDPVQISRLYETGEVRFAGSYQHLGALILLAGPLAPHYAASLERRGRRDLLDTPLPPTKIAWGDPREAHGAPRKLIGERRPWQRPKRARAAA
ncbi:MAG: hypothetical protein QOF17_145 [Solirubrobacteraceae bacterium]|nr:hypothetical protein [Solirubrobacteraceae bacterium]